MEEVGAVSLIIILANVGFSLYGFSNESFFQKFLFQVERILFHKEYYRMISSGFLHGNGPHLIFNMLSLYFFSGEIERYAGKGELLLIYFLSLIGGNLFSLFVHRNQSSYSAIGASGAVCGIIFAAIALFPGMKLGLFGMPFFIPAWLYGLIFIAISIYGIRSQKGNVGHEAHLGGAMAGIILAVILHPLVLEVNLNTILIVTIPSAAFILITIWRPDVLITGSFVSTKKKYHNIDEKYNVLAKERQREVDRILEKINRNGIESLTPIERKILDDYSGR